ncbi:MAG: hypothetical protein MTP17_04275 [Candidatus Midichloria sp.]|nr:MAG: hypothetical protein MTP17_04275 [Candidatus Midichloria sp.]
MADSLLQLGDSLPALGIIVAVLRVVTAMGAVEAEPAMAKYKNSICSNWNFYRSIFIL